MWIYFICGWNNNFCARNCYHKLAMFISYTTNYLESNWIVWNCVYLEIVFLTMM